MVRSSPGARRPRWALFVLFGVAWACSSGAPAAFPAERRECAPEDTASRRALLVGINAYEYPDDIPRLAGTHNDARAMRDVLVERFGFRPCDIRMLLDGDATRAGIERAFREHLIEPATEETVAVFYFSGHGSLRRDRSGEEPSGYDQTLVAYDSGRSGTRPNRDVADDDIGSWLEQLGSKTENVTVVFDSCHSGTASKSGVTAGRRWKVKRAPVDERVAPAAPAAGSSSRSVSGFRGRESRYVTISAAASDEDARELEGKAPMGAFTSRFVQRLRAASPDDTYRDVMEAVSSEVTAEFSRQHPQLEGSRDNLLFRAGSWAREPFYLVKPSGRDLVMSAGILNGLNVGTTLHVYPPGSRSFERADAIARAEVIRVESLSSQLKVTSGTTPPALARAVVAQQALGQVALRVHLAGLDASAQLRDLARELRSRDANIELADSAREADIIVADDAGKLSVKRSKPLGIQPRQPLVSGAAAVTEVGRQLRAWARWYALLRLDNIQPRGIDARFIVPHLVRAQDDVRPQLANRTRDRLYFSIFDLSDDGSIVQLYPSAGAQAFLEPTEAGSQNTAFDFGDEVLYFCIPAGWPEITDAVKVIFTRTRHDLSDLEQPAIAAGDSPVRSSAPAPDAGALRFELGQLLGEHRKGGGSRRLEASDWLVRQERVRIVGGAGQRCE